MDLEEIQVLNSIGEVVLTGDRQRSFDLSGLPKGLYVFVVKGGGQQLVKKVLLHD